MNGNGNGNNVLQRFTSCSGFFFSFFFLPAFVDKWVCVVVDVVKELAREVKAHRGSEPRA